MILPKAPAAYERADQDRLREALRRADGEYLKRGRDVEVGSGRLILTAPDGSRWAIRVSNTGLLTAAAV